MRDWLTLHRGNAPLIVSIPHAGTDIPADIEARLVSPWRARRDADFFVSDLYAFARDLDATLISTGISRTVIDVNRDPSGASLYPGQATTDLCPITTFDGEPLYRNETALDAAEIAARRERWFGPYHTTIAAEIARLKDLHRNIALYDAHSIRSRVPRLFDGLLPVFNIGTNAGVSCASQMEMAVRNVCETSNQSTVVNGRFKGGYITRQYGRPPAGVHAIQMELVMRSYLNEPAAPDESNWPPPYDEGIAALIRPTLKAALAACLTLALEES